MDSVTNIHFRRLALDVLTAMGGPLAGAKLGLTKALVPVDKQMLFADFTANAADYTGYATQAETWLAAGSDGLGIVRAYGAAKRYALTGTVALNQLFNAYLMDAGATVLLAAGILPGLQMAQSLDNAVVVVPSVSWTGPLQSAGCVAECLTTVDTDLDSLDALSAPMALLDGAEIHLFKQPLAITPFVTLADLQAVEANYTGYAAAVIPAWSDAYLGADGRARVLGEVPIFRPTGSAVGNTIFGGFVTTPMAAALLWAWSFDIPRALGSAADGLEADAELIYGT